MYSGSCTLTACNIRTGITSAMRSTITGDGASITYWLLGRWRRHAAVRTSTWSLGKRPGLRITRWCGRSSRFSAGASSRSVTQRTAVTLRRETQTVHRAPSDRNMPGRHCNEGTMIHIRRFFFLILAAGLLVIPAYSQPGAGVVGAAIVKGTLTDESGGVIPAANVTLTG